MEALSCLCLEGRTGVEEGGEEEGMERWRFMDFFLFFFSLFNKINIFFSLSHGMKELF